MIVPVILSGGSGTRLWPLSTPEKPKQFLPLVTDKTLFQETLLRLEGIDGLSAPIVVCNAAHRFLVAEQLREIGVTAAAIVLEPEGRNTAPAIGVAAIVARESVKQGSEPFLLVLPADHVIGDAKAFREAVGCAIRAAEAGRLVTFGIVPTRPETGYGYIEQGAAEQDWAIVERFVEKPDAATAKRYLATGKFLWNSGMFVFRARDFLAELGRLAPEIHAACERAGASLAADDDFMRLGGDFLASPSDSIDYAVMEKTERAAVVSLDAGWNDVGSWNALYDVLEKDANENVLRGRVAAQDCRGSLIQTNGKPVAAIGLVDAVVVLADAGLLVANRADSQVVKQLAAEIGSADVD